MDILLSSVAANTMGQPSSKEVRTSKANPRPKEIDSKAKEFDSEAPFSSTFSIVQIRIWQSPPVVAAKKVLGFTLRAETLVTDSLRSQSLAAGR